MESSEKRGQSRNKGCARNLAANFHQDSTNLKRDVLPPIGVFWDIENCHVPKGKSSIALVCNIRKKFFNGHREAEFMCVCDVNKENQDVVRELNLAQVTVVHVNATSKNAADDKLRQCMRRFVEVHRSPSTIVLISGDINFATDLSDFRHRLKIHVILIHNRHTPDSLLACAHETYLFSDLTNNLPNRNVTKSTEPCEILVSNLPTNKDSKQIQQRLKQLSDNCGGKVVIVLASTAILKFPSADAAQRACKRMDKEDVYGHKISVSFSNRNDSIPVTHATPNASLSTQPAPSLVDDFALEKIINMMHQSGSKQSMYRGSRALSSPSRVYGDSSIVAACTSPIGPPNGNRGPQRFYEYSTNHSDIQQTDTRSLWRNDSFFSDREIVTLPSSNGLNGYSHFESNHDHGISDQTNFERPLSPPKSYSKVSSVPSHYHQHQNYSSAQNQLYYNQDNCSKMYQSKSIGRVSPFMMANQSCHGCSSTTSSHYRSTSPFPRSTVYDDHDQTHDVNGHASRYNSNTAIRGRAGNLSPGSDSLIVPGMSRSEQSYAYRSRSASPLSNGRNGMPCDNYHHGVELLVTNLDQTLEINEMKKVLMNEFSDHVMVLHISMLLQPDGTYKAVVKLANAQDAQLAISQLQRKRIGYKRILISYASGGKAPPLNILRAEVAALLIDLPSKKMPLFKFRELFFNRYHRTIGISELYKLGDTVLITEDNSGRMVSLVPNYRSTPSPIDTEMVPIGSDGEKPYCERHMTLAVYRQLSDEAQTTSLLPDVCISLKVLAPRVHRLLDIHQGNLPLNSFGACYEAEFENLPVAKNPDNTILKTENENKSSDCCPCVPLEHLISCIPGVEITKSAFGIKKVRWMENKVDPTNRSISPALVGKLMLFSREMSDLLKSQTPRCCIPFSKLIPAYHHHFGRQCRVADYGFTKLIDLMEALPHIVQLLGEGHNRMLTLTHSTQLKRFASDLTRILKSRPTKQISLSEFPEAYQQCMDRNFDIAHYGVCDISDMLSELSDTIVITQVENDTVIAIPKREQTPEEIERTKQFAIDVFELLRHTPSCSLPFNKFIPSYHHHFGRQCRVSSYGFTKLIELFEAIPDVLEVIGHGEDKVLRLTMQERLKVLTERTVAILNCKMFPKEKLLVKNFLNQYAKHHGHCLKLKDYECDSVEQLLVKINHAVRIEDYKDGKVLVLVDRSTTDLLGMRIKNILMNQSNGELTLEELAKLYEKRFYSDLDLNATMMYIHKELNFKDGKVQLSPILKICRDIINLLKRCESGMQLPNLERSFLEQYGYPLQTAKFGYSSISAFLSGYTEYFSVKGRRGKKTVSLVSDAFEDSALDSPFALDEDTENGYAELEREILEARSEQSSEVDEETTNLLQKSPMTILNQPIPSCVPSPSLSPESQPQGESNLMGFETPFSLNFLDTDPENHAPNQQSLFSSTNFYFKNSKEPSTSNATIDNFSTLMNSSEPTDYKRLKMAFDPIPPSSWLSSSTLNVNAEVFNSRQNHFEHHSSEDIFLGSSSIHDDLGLSSLNLSFDSAKNGQTSPSKAVGSRPSRKIAAAFAKPISQ